MEDGYNFEDIGVVNVHIEYDHACLKIFYRWRNFKELNLGPEKFMKLLEYA